MDWSYIAENCLLKHNIEGKIDGMGINAKRYKQLLHELKEKRRYCNLKKGNTKQHSVEHSLWKRLWTCHKTDYIMNGLPMF